MDKNTQYINGKRVYKGTAEDKAIFQEEVIKNYLSEEFLQRIEENRVNIEFEECDRKELLADFNHSGDRHRFANSLKTMLDLADIFDESTQIGVQTFLPTDNCSDIKKSWKNVSNVSNSSRFDDPRQKLAIKRKNDIYFTMEPHYCSRFYILRNNIKYLNNPIIKSEINTVFMNPPSDKKVKIDLRKDEKHIKIFKYIECKNKTRGHSQNKNSRILWIDIDHDYDLSKMYKFLELTNLRMFHAEHSFYSGGDHLYIKLDKTFDDEYRKMLELYCKEQGLKIECCFYNKFLQLPCSVDYSPIELDIFENQHKIRYLNQLNKAHLLYTLHHSSIRFDKITNSTDKLISLLEGKSYFDDIFEIEETKEVLNNTTSNSKSNRWDFINKYPVRFGIKNKDGSVKSKKHYEFIYAEAGNKFNAQKNNIFTMCELGLINPDYPDYDLVREYLTKYQGTSTTISKTPNRDIDVFLRYYKEQNNYVSYSNYNKTIHNSIVDHFISNKDLIPEDFKKLISKCEYNFNESFYNNSKTYYKDKKHSKKRQLKVISSFLLYESFGSFIYQYNNPTEIILPNNLPLSLSKEQLTGFSISVKQIKLALEYLKQNHLISYDFDPRNIRDILVKTLNLIPTFLYRNMNKDTYNVEDNDSLTYNYFLNGLPIQYNINRANTLEQFTNNLYNYINIYNNNLLFNKSVDLNKLIEKDIKENLFYNMYYVESNLKENNEKEYLSLSDPPG